MTPYLQAGLITAALKFCRKGDALLATKLDRLGRSVHDLAVLGRMLEDKGVHLKVLDQSWIHQQQQVVLSTVCSASLASSRPTFAVNARQKA